MSRTERFSKAQVLTAIVENHGMVAVAARRLNCARNTIRNYAARYPDIAAALEEEREVQTDETELALFKKIEEGDMQAIIFYLETQAKHRGYVKKDEERIGMNINVSIEYVNDWRGGHHALPLLELDGPQSVTEEG